MELYEIKEKVGSDPCLVLDFDADVTVAGSTVTFKTEIKTVDSIEEATDFITDFSNLIESLTQTRCVLFRFKTHAETGIFNNNITVSPVISFSFAGGQVDARTLNVYLTAGGNIAMSVSLIATQDVDKYIIEFLGTVSL